MGVQGGSEFSELSHLMRIWYIKGGNTEPQHGHLYMAESLKVQIKTDPFIWYRTEQMRIKEAWAF